MVVRVTVREEPAGIVFVRVGSGGIMNIGNRHARVNREVEGHRNIVRLVPVGDDQGSGVSVFFNGRFNNLETAPVVNNTVIKIDQYLCTGTSCSDGTIPLATNRSPEGKETPRFFCCRFVCVQVPFFVAVGCLDMPISCLLYTSPSPRDS